MKKIKFRAWDTKRHIMFTAEEMGEDQLTLLPDGGGFINVSSIHTRQSEMLTHLLPLEYTGLKDKNGKEIYEGDIVMATYDSHLIFKITYLLEKEFAGFCLENPLSKEDYYLHYNPDEFEIIGNIYENPELLKNTLRESDG
jgi:uncharacterized phage protein (TIGR01671 family)